MLVPSLDPRDIPILTDEVTQDGRTYTAFDAKAVHAALVTATLNLADSLLHRATKDIEAILFERVFDQLRNQLPELLDRVLREYAAAEVALPADAAPSAAKVAAAATGTP